MEKYSNVILSNMCMVYNNKDEILVQMREKKDWSGLTFPGGHVEDNESLVESVIREIKEETGLTIKNPQLCDVYEWPWENNSRYLAFLYKTNDFEGEILSSKEGKVFWIKKADINKYKLSTDFIEIFNAMENSNSRNNL